MFWNGKTFPSGLSDKIISVDQRSQEWLRLLTYYKCGKNTGLVPYDGIAIEWVQFYFNLIRGCFVEQMVLHGVDISKTTSFVSWC